MAQSSSPAPLIKRDPVTLAQRLSDVETQSHTSMAPITGYQSFALLPLNIAVKTLEEEGKVPRVLQNAIIAKQSVRDVSDGLTKDECAAIYLYTMDWQPRDQTLSMQMNAALRTQDQKQMVPYYAFLKLFLTALSKLPPVTTTVWRGVTGDLSQEYLTETNFVWWGFSSCTESLDLLESDQFLGKSGKRTLFNIQCQSGKNIRAHSSFMGESEILLLPGTEFQVLGRVNPAPDLHIIHIKEVVSTNSCLQRPLHMPATTSPLVNTNVVNQTTSSKKKEHSTASKSMPLEKPKIPVKPSNALQKIREDALSSNHPAKVTSLRQMFEKGASTSHKSVPALHRAPPKTLTTAVSLELPTSASMKTETQNVSTPKITAATPPDESHDDISTRGDGEVHSDSQLQLYNNKGLEDFICMDRTVARVSFWNENLNNQDAELVISELMVNVHWSQVCLSCNSLGLRVGNGLADVLASTSVITQLFLDNNQLGDEGVARLAWSLYLNRTLVELRLDFNAIAHSGALELAAMLYLNTTIEKLSLSGNAIGDKGMKAFAKALPNNTTLLELNVSSNGITDDCVKEILKMLERQDSLEFLDLRDNQLSEESNMAITRTADRLDILRGQSQYGVEKLISEVNAQREEILRLEDVYSETITARVLLQTQIQSLEEEWHFLKCVYEEEINIAQQVSIGIDVTAFYQAELTRAIASIKTDFDGFSKIQEAELNEYYKTKTEKIRDETHAMTNSPTAETSLQLLVELCSSIPEITETRARLQSEHAAGLQKFRELDAILHDMKESNGILIDDQERQIRVLKTSITYVTDRYSKTKLKNAYLQAEINSYRKLTQAQ